MNIQPKITLLYESSQAVENSQIIDGQNIYKCDFDDILVKVLTKPNAQIKLINTDDESVLTMIKTDEKGNAAFRINSLKPKTRMNFAVLIYAENLINFRYKFVIFLDTSKSDLDVSKKKSVNSPVELLKNHNYKANSQTGTNFMVDLMEMTDMKFDVENVLHTNEHYPVFKFKVSDYDEFKLFIIGFNGYLFGEPDLIDGEISYEKDYFVFICKSKFFLEGKYMFVVRYFDSDGTKEPKEEHFVLWVKFSNDDILKANLEFNEIYGDGASSECKVILFSINEQNGFDEIKRVMSDKFGKFSIKLTEKELNLFKTRKFLLKSLDKHGNFSKPFVIN